MYYINLRSSRDGTLFGCLCVRVCESDPCFIQFALASCYIRCSLKRIVEMKVYIKRNNIQVELIRFRKNSDFIAFEVGIIILSQPTCPLLSATSRHCSVHGVAGAPDVSGHAQLGTVTDMSYRDRHESGLFEVTMYRQFALSKRQFGSNSLLFTPFMTV